MTPDPALVVLFSGHMLDRPDRAEPRFPESKVPAAAAAIGQALGRLGVRPGDLAISSAACGGDTLFAEAAIARRMWLELYHPLPEPEFLAASVAFAGPGWVRRYEAIERSPQVRARRFLADAMGPVPESEVYERTNLWMLDDALAHGPAKARMICLWDGKGGDGPGGTRHIVELIRAKAGAGPVIIDPRTLPEA